MSRICAEFLDLQMPDRFLAADVFAREEPDEEDDEEGSDDENSDDDEEQDDDGYSE